MRPHPHCVCTPPAAVAIRWEQRAAWRKLEVVGLLRELVEVQSGPRRCSGSGKCNLGLDGMSDEFWCECDQGKSSNSIN